MTSQQQELLEAIVESYALVGVSDGALVEAEVERFTSILEDIDPTAARAALGMVKKRLRDDFETAVEEIESRLSNLRTRPGAARIVFDSARRAVVADGRIDVREELVLARIAGLLGIEESPR